MKLLLLALFIFAVCPAVKAQQTFFGEIQYKVWGGSEADKVLKVYFGNRVYSALEQSTSEQERKFPLTVFNAATGETLKADPATKIYIPFTPDNLNEEDLYIGLDTYMVYKNDTLKGYLVNFGNYGNFLAWASTRLYTACLSGGCSPKNWPFVVNGRIVLFLDYRTENKTIKIMADKITRVSQPDTMATSLAGYRARQPDNFIDDISTDTSAKGSLHMATESAREAEEAAKMAAAAEKDTAAKALQPEPVIPGCESLHIELKALRQLNSRFEKENADLRRKIQQLQELIMAINEQRQRGNKPKKQLP